MAGTGTSQRRRRRTAAVPPEPRRFSVDEYYRMAEAGILGPDERVELLEGAIIEMAPIGSWHAYCVAWLTNWFSSRLMGRAVVWAQNPVRLDSGSEPEPDLALLRPPLERYRQRHPGPADVFLIVEVADTSLAYDRNQKRPLYAAAGIPEVWIVDLLAQQVIVCREPHGSGYRRVTAVSRDGTCSPEAFPDVALPVRDLFGSIDA